MSNLSDSQPIWRCSNDYRSQTNIDRFRKNLNQSHAEDLANYADMHDWSVRNPGLFWSQLWDFCSVVGDKGECFFDPKASMFEAEFFPQARLNFAENILTNSDVLESDDALVFWGEDVVRQRLSWKELRDAVSQMAQALRELGVKKGDRVAAYMPNIPETIIAMLASSSIGAIWSSCSPDFGVQGVLDRFGQVEPTILIAADGYFYSGKKIDNLAKVAQITDEIHSIEKVIIVPYLRTNNDSEASLEGVANSVLYEDLLNQYKATDLDFEALPFDHPLYILYSSGTTGAPKCIVHGAGGTLLQHLKEQQLHCDLKPNDRLFYFTTCTWMMWNWLVSGLASGATLLLFDGSPFYPNETTLFDYAEQEGMTHFGTSAKYIDALKNEKVNTTQSHDLSKLRMMCSTGSPLVPESFDYVYESLKEDVYLASISGGTDIISCFVLGNPSSDLCRGEIACKGLGMAIDAVSYTHLTLPTTPYV